MKTTPLTIIILFLLSFKTFSQPSNEWIRYIDGLSVNSSGNSLCNDTNGNIIVTGKLNNQIFISKYTGNGVIYWQVFYNGLYNDEVQKVLLHTDGGIVILGTAYISGSADIFLYKISNSGDSLWFRNFNSSGNFGDFAENMIIDLNGNIYAIGSSMTPLGYDYTLLKYDSNGNLLWSRNYNGALNSSDLTVMLNLDNSNNLYVLGNSGENSSFYTTTIIKYNSGGSIIWSKVIDSLFIYKNCSRIDFDGNLYVTGVNDNFLSKTIKLNSNSSIQWINYDTQSRGEPVMCINSTGYSFISSRNSEFSSEDIRTKCIDNNGNQLWTTVYGSLSGVETPIKIIYEPSNYLIVTAKLDAFTGFLKYDLNGQLLWTYKDVARPTFTKDMVLDNNRNIFTTGRCVFGNANIFTAKYNQVVGIQPISIEIPEQYSLSQNYPNPFNPATKIRFTLPEGSDVKLIIYDALGRTVKTIVNEILSPGVYETDFDSGELSSGIYYYKITANNFSETKKMVLLK